MPNILHVRFNGKRTAKVIENGWQWDYGQILKFDDLDLPNSYQVHFSNDKTFGDAKQMVGNEDGVLIPDEYFQTGDPIYAFVYLHTGDDDGETEYCATIYVNKRPEPTDIEPTPVEQSTIDSLIIALNDAVEQTASDRQSADESATSAAESESNALAYAERAESARDRAVTAETNAESSESSASASAASASNSASAAASSASSASTDAERAEQAAAQSGYMFFYIDENGDQHYQRTSNVNVDFYLHEGDLYVRAVN